MKKTSSKIAPNTHDCYRKRWNLILFAFYMYILVRLGYFSWANSLGSTGLGEGEHPEAWAERCQPPKTSDKVVAASAELGVTSLQGSQ